MHTASLSPLPSDSRKLIPAPATANPANVTTIATVKSEPPPAAPPPATAIPPVSRRAAHHRHPVLSRHRLLRLWLLRRRRFHRAIPLPAAKPGALVAPPAKVASAANTVPVPAAAAAPATKPRGGWMIQVGAFPDEKEAKQRLAAAQSKAKDQLGKADPFTERMAKGDKPLYRARFAGLDKDQAETACKHLKRSEIPCMLLKN